MHIDQKMTIKQDLTIESVYTTGSNVDESNASGQKVVKVTATTNFAVGDRVILGRGTSREEEGIIASISAGVSITLVDNLTYNHTFTQQQTLDQQSAAAQKNVYITATANLLAGETVIIDKGNANEESGVIDTVTANDYITLVANLANTHAIGVKVDHTGVAGVVETCMASISSVLDKSKYKNFTLFLPSNWTTAVITFLGCRSEDGTFVQVVNPDNVAEAEIDSVAASKCISLTEEPSLAAIPFIKIRSGTASVPVDQGITDKTIEVALTR